jgi:hypothetical protein
MKRVLLTAGLIIAFMAFAGNADIPQTLNYQGVLTDAGGTAVSDGDYIIEFNIYDIASGGTALWTETDTVTVSKGIFSVVLGRWMALNLDFDEPYWLGMSVEGENELDPRVELTATAYSLNSQGVTGTDNVFPSSGYVGIGTTSPTHTLTIEGDPSEQIALQLNGNNTSWNNLFVNSIAGARPGYGYLRSGVLRAHTYVDVNDAWRLKVGVVDAFSVLASGNAGIGILNPNERLHINGAVRIGSSAGLNAGTIQWTGSDFEGYDGSTWQSLTGGVGGNLPAGASGYTLRHNGSDWVASSLLYNNGTRIGIGTTGPVTNLHIYENIDGQVGLRIENPNTGEQSTESITFRNEDGDVAGITLFDDDNAIYSSQMHIFNNRPSGEIDFRTGGSSSVIINEIGRVGIGTSYPNAMLEVIGNDIRNHFKLRTTGGAGPAINFSAVNKDWIIFASNPAAVAGDQKLVFRDQSTSTYAMVIDADHEVGIGTTDPVKRLDVAGSIRAADTLISPIATLGSWGDEGELRLLRRGMSGGSVAFEAEAVTDGVWMRLLDAEGDATHYFDADGNGEGGYFSVMRNGIGSPGFVVDGNRNGTLNTAVTIYGASRSAEFDMSSSGDDCVILPPDAISSSEILDEAGGAGVNNLDLSGITLTPATYSVLASRSITVPAAGYVLVTSACQLTIDHVSPANSYSDVGVSDVTNSFATSTDMTVAIAGAAPTGRYIIPASSTALFTVSAGTHTFYMLGRGGAGTVNAYDVNLVAVFIPSAYGTVSPTLTSTSDGIEEGTTRAMSSSDIAAERAESIAFNEARIARELEEMRAKIAELERMVNNR